jgi:hypothetical protein
MLTEEAYFAIGAAALHKEEYLSSAGTINYALNFVRAL